MNDTQERENHKEQLEQVVSPPKVEDIRPALITKYNDLRGYLLGGYSFSHPDHTDLSAEQYLQLVALFKSAEIAIATKLYNTPVDNKARREIMKDTLQKYDELMAQFNEENSQPQAVAQVEEQAIYNEVVLNTDWVDVENEWLKKLEDRLEEPDTYPLLLTDIAANQQYIQAGKNAYRNVIAGRGNEASHVDASIEQYTGSAISLIRNIENNWRQVDADNVEGFLDLHQLTHILFEITKQFQHEISMRYPDFAKDASKQLRVIFEHLMRALTEQIKGIESKLGTTGEDIFPNIRDLIAEKETLLRQTPDKRNIKIPVERSHKQEGGVIVVRDILLYVIIGLVVADAAGLAYVYLEYSQEFYERYKQEIESIIQQLPFLEIIVRTEINSYPQLAQLSARLGRALSG